MPIFHCPICNFKSTSEKDEKEHAKTHQKPLSVPATISESKKKEGEGKYPKSLDFLKRFLHKTVAVTLIGESVISGELTGFNNYEIMLDDKIMILKHAMMKMKEIEPRPVALEG